MSMLGEAAAGAADALGASAGIASTAGRDPLAGANRSLSKRQFPSEGSDWTAQYHPDHPAVTAVKRYRRAKQIGDMLQGNSGGGAQAPDSATVDEEAGNDFGAQAQDQSANDVGAQINTAIAQERVRNRRQQQQAQRRQR